MVSDRAGPRHTSRCRCAGCSLPLLLTASASRSEFLRGCISGPYVPLSTLRRCPCEQLRMTRGRCGSLFLHRVTFHSLHSRRTRSRTWIIIGVDYHPSDQYIAFTDTETGECGEQQLNHSDGEAEKFYRELTQRRARSEERR